MNPFWISILACVLLKERIRLIEIIGIFICFGGVIMIATSKAGEEDDDTDENSITAQVDQTDKDSEDSESPSELNKYLGVIIAFSGAITFAICSVFNRKLKAIDYSALMVYHGLIGGVLAALFILIEAAIVGHFRIYTAWQYGVLLAASVWDASACNSMTIAYQSDSSGFVSLLGYAIIVYGFASDVLIFNEQLVALQLLGALLIFSATFFVAVFKLCEAKTQR